MRYGDEAVAEVIHLDCLVLEVAVEGGELAGAGA